jgi:hypothetical protein
MVAGLIFAFSLRATVIFDSYGQALNVSHLPLTLTISRNAKQTPHSHRPIGNTMAKSTSNEELACVALSELFLDTAITSTDLDYIARCLRPLNIPTDIVIDLLRYDVFPILYPTLLDIAGVWTGFDREWLVGRIQTRRNGTK